jgi:hypothetical protein
VCWLNWCHAPNIVQCSVSLASKLCTIGVSMNKSEGGILAWRLALSCCPMTAFLLELPLQKPVQ